MKIIVTGSSGFIGKNLVRSLKSNGHNVCSVDISTGYDVAEWDSVKDLHDFDIMIHLAAITYVPQSFEIPREMFRVNINGTLNMLELCRQNKAKMIFASSYIYGKPHYLPIDEEHPVSSHNPYCQSKIIGEKLCESYNKDFDVPIVIFRAFNIYGAKQNPSFLIPLIKKQIDEKGEVVLKDSKPLRDYIHISDVVKAYMAAVDHNNTGFEIFNIASGKSYSVKEIAELMVELSPNDIKIYFTEEKRKNEVMNIISDIKKIKNILDWEPEVSLEKGLKDIIKQTETVN